VGLFGKGKKASWEGNEEGELSFFVGKEDLSGSCNSMWYGRHIVLYCGDVGAYYLLEDYLDKTDGSRYPAEFITDESDALYVHDEEFAFTLFYRGEAINDLYPFTRIEEDMWFYNEESGEHYLLGNVEKIKADVFVVPTIAGTDPQAGFYYLFKNNTFRFVYQGNDRSEEVTLLASEDDVLVYLEDADRQFLIQGGMKMKKNSWKEDYFSNPGDMPLYKKLPGNQYRLYERGVNKAGKCAGVKIGPHAVVYDPEKVQNYWVDNGFTLNDYVYQDATPFAEGCKLLWYRNGNDYHIYYETREITREVQLQRYENNAIVMHEESMSMFQLENFFTVSDGVVRGV
jgi:hypothetical protein